MGSGWDASSCFAQPYVAVTCHCEIAPLSRPRLSNQPNKCTFVTACPPMGLVPHLEGDDVIVLGVEDVHRHPQLPHRRPHVLSPLQQQQRHAHVKHRLTLDTAQTDQSTLPPATPQRNPTHTCTQHATGSPPFHHTCYPTCHLHPPTLLQPPTLRISTPVRTRIHPWSTKPSASYWAACHTNSSSSSSSSSRKHSQSAQMTTTAVATGPGHNSTHLPHTGPPVTPAAAGMTSQHRWQR
jgi:hypothetical protein